MSEILSKHWDIPIKEIEDHYAESKKNYEGLALEGGKVHIAYYRDKHPVFYTRLKIKYLWDDDQRRIAEENAFKIESDWFFENEAKEAFEIEQMKRDEDE